MTNCKYCKADCARRGEDREKECRGYIPMTNGDRFRAMSDEELVELFCNTTLCPEGLVRRMCRYMSCKKCWTNYLKSPVEQPTNTEA